MEEVIVESVRSGLLHIAKGQRLMCNGSEVDESSFKKVQGPPPDATKCQTCFKDTAIGFLPPNPETEAPSLATSPRTSPQTSPRAEDQAPRHDLALCQQEEVSNDDFQVLASGQQVDVSVATSCPVYELHWETVNWQNIVKFLSLDAVRTVPKLFDALASIADRTVALNGLHRGKIPVAGFVGSAPPGLRGVPLSGVVELPSDRDFAAPCSGDSQVAKKLKNAPNLAKVWGKLPKQVEAELVYVQKHLAGTSLAEHSDLRLTSAFVFSNLKLVLWAFSGMAWSTKNWDQCRPPCWSSQIITMTVWNTSSTSWL